MPTCSNFKGEFMPHPQQGLRALGLLIFLFQLLLPVLAGCTGGSDLSFPTEYQAVFLDNGQVFFGKIGAADSSFLTLREVFYVQRVASDEKKAARNILMRLGSEWHGPDFMRINTRHIVRLEPVAPDSQVAKLIREAKAAPAAAAPPTATAPAPAAAPAKGEKKAAPARR
jgi:hypothetical protein